MACGSWESMPTQGWGGRGLVICASPVSDASHALYNMGQYGAMYQPDQHWPPPKPREGGARTCMAGIRCGQPDREAAAE